MVGRCDDSEGRCDDSAGRCDVLAVGAHPDDVELGCGATLARLAAMGRVTAILDLSAGERGTRGDVELRARESTCAAAALAVAWRSCLGLADGGIDGRDAEQQGRLVEVLRRAQPRAVFLPAAGDPHPDHDEAGLLCRRAAFLSGVARFRPESGAPHRPRLLLGYPGPRQCPAGAVVVDVTAAYAAKQAALACHASQFTPAAGPPTHLASGSFLAAIEGRDRAAGNLIGAALGEAFEPVGPLAADELVWLLGERGGC